MINTLITLKAMNAFKPRVSCINNRMSCIISGRNMPMMHRENIQNFRLVGGGKSRSYTNNIGASKRNVKNSNKNNAVEGESTATSGGEVLAEKIPPPTAQQLIIHIIRSSIPMIGFGFMDNTIMIHAGHYVDCTIGVTFSLSTLAAAGIGQIFSGIGGVLFGDALEVAFHRIAGVESGASIMTKAQRSLRVSRMAGLFGGVLGVALGCTLGLVNLLFVDENKASLLKLQALEDGQEFEFEVEVDNTAHPGYTTVVVRGPDVDGVLASITAGIASFGCSVVELHAGLRKKELDEEQLAAIRKVTTVDAEPSNSTPTSFLDSLQSQTVERVEDTFLIRDRTTHQALDNEDLDPLARTILAAAKDPLNSHSLKSQLEDLEIENMALADRVLALEKKLEDQQIKIVPAALNTDAER